MSSPLLAIAAVMAASTASLGADAPASAAAWITNPDRSALFARQGEGLKWEEATPGGRAIDIEDGRPFQGIDGFGFALTQGLSLIHI